VVGVALVTLLPIINPLSTAVLLLGISGHLSKEERNRQIVKACLYMTAILVVFLLAGHFVMVAFGISIPGIRIAGGMIIGLLGFRMLFPDDGEITGEGKEEARQKLDISFSPLAMPSLSGPGSIAAVITMSSTIDGRHGIDKVFGARVLCVGSLASTASTVFRALWVFCLCVLGCSSPSMVFGIWFWMWNSGHLDPIPNTQPDGQMNTCINCFSKFFK
jgi:small neutral amino acid transporter SnatA (MarC family)